MNSDTRFNPQIAHTFCLRRLSDQCRGAQSGGMRELGVEYERFRAIVSTQSSLNVSQSNSLNNHVLRARDQVRMEIPTSTKMEGLSRLEREGESSMSSDTLCLHFQSSLKD